LPTVGGPAGKAKGKNVCCKEKTRRTQTGPRRGVAHAAGPQAIQGGPRLRTGGAFGLPGDGGLGGPLGRKLRGTCLQGWVRGRRAKPKSKGRVGAGVVKGRGPLKGGYRPAHEGRAKTGVAGRGWGRAGRRPARSASFWQVRLLGGRLWGADPGNKRLGRPIFAPSGGGPARQNS